MILNLTQHPGTIEQGVVDLKGDDLAKLKELLTFDDIPTSEEINRRARNIATLAKTYDPEAAMIGGALYLMTALEKSLRAVGIVPLYAFSRRESVEEMVEGRVVKHTIFRHLGYVMCRNTESTWPSGFHRGRW